MMIDEQHTPGTESGLELQAPNLGSLDDYEWRILALIGQGRLTRQVAAALAISEETLGDHIEGILEKLGLKSRLDLWMFVVAPHELESEPELAPSGFETLLRR